MPRTRRLPRTLGDGYGTRARRGRGRQLGTRVTSSFGAHGAPPIGSGFPPVSGGLGAEQIQAVRPGLAGGSGIAGIVARTICSARTSAAHIFLARREPRELHQVGVAQRGLDLVEHGDPRLDSRSRIKRLARRAFQTVEPVAVAQVLADRIGHAVEVLGVALTLDQPGVFDVVELLERDFPRRSRRRRRWDRLRPSQPAADQPRHQRADHERDRADQRGVFGSSPLLELTARLRVVARHGFGVLAIGSSTVIVCG